MNLYSFEGKELMRAEGDITGETITGKATFIEYEFKSQKIVKIELEMQGDPSILNPGLHAVHIHEKGTCEGGFKCAGGHFDPGPSGNTDPDINHPLHAGDLPSIEIDGSGKGKLEAITTRVTLSDGLASIITAEEGTALMIHKNPDPYKGGEHGSGISGGPRIACGIIKKI